MRRRSGFTITELLVSMALIVFIMSILAGAFDAGVGAVSRLKAIGDMNDRLRSASTVLRRYLAADHFEGKKRLSDAQFWQNGPPLEGFFRIYQGSPSVFEGTDLDGLPSYRATDHGLHFAVKLRGNGLDDFFQAAVPAGSPLLDGRVWPYPDSRYQNANGGTTVSSPWAEVAVFMKASGDTARDPETGAELPLYTLYLRKRVAVPDNTDDTIANGAALTPPLSRVPYTEYSSNGNYLEVSCLRDPANPTFLSFSSQRDLTMPVRRLGATGASDFAGTRAISNYPTLAAEPGGAQAGNDVLLTDVLSFDVRVLLPPVTGRNNEFVDLFDTAYFVAALNNPSFGTAKVFDTWSRLKDQTYDYGTHWNQTGDQGANNAYKIPLHKAGGGYQVRIRAIQVTIRIWDAKSGQARQTSIIQDM